MPEPDPDKESKMATAEVLPIDKPANWAAPNSYMISTEDLWKTYDMGSEQVHALRGINLRIQRNEYVAIMGPSGSGKSTLMNLIGCLDTPSKGQYWLNGNLVSELDDDELARIRNKEIGFVFQTFQPAGPRHRASQRGAAADLCRHASEARRERAEAAEDGRHGRPHEPQAQRTLRRPAPARRHRPRLVNKPSIILADEPTGNLDSTNRRRNHGAVRRLHAEGNTIILVTHEHDIAEYAHRVIHIKDGVIAKDEVKR